MRQRERRAAKTGGAVLGAAAHRVVGGVALGKGGVGDEGERKLAVGDAADGVRDLQGAAGKGGVSLSVGGAQETRAEARKGKGDARRRVALKEGSALPLRLFGRLFG